MTFLQYFGRISKICLLLLVFAIQASFAQGTGIIRGAIYDGNTKDELPGANVIVKGTNIGVASNLDGKFLLRNVPVGKQIVIVSYLGYLSDTVDVDIPDNGTLELDFNLATLTLEGEEVLVTAQAQGQLEAINQQLSSDKIANIVSETRIQELPDFNAAQTISRLPGISTLQSSGEANKIVIRGLAPQFNSIEIEGFKLASTGSTTIGVRAIDYSGDRSSSIDNDRSVDISMISPYMLKTVAVYKSLTPDMNANAIGGTVNMELREAPSELHIDMLWQSGYTAKSKEYGNYRGVASVSRRFFNDKFGAYLLGNIESYDRNSDNMTAAYFTTNIDIDPASGYRPVQVNNVEQVRHIETRQRYGGNLILDYKLPSGSIKSINMFTRLNSDYEDYRQVLDYGNQGNIDFRYRAGENSVDQALNSVELNYDFDIIQADLKFANTYSFNSLPYSPYFLFLQNGGIDINTQPLENRIPEDLVGLQHYDDLGGGIAGTTLQDLNLFSTNYKENNQNYKANFKIPFTVGSDFSAYFKAGGVYDYQSHTNDQETPYIILNNTNDLTQRIMESVSQQFNLDWSGGARFRASDFTSNDDELYDTFLDDRFGRLYWMVDPSILTDMLEFISSNPEFAGRNNGAQDVGGWFHGAYQSLTNDYKYNEKYYAGYAMSEINFLDFMIVGGVRYEKVNSKYEVYNMINSTNPNAQTVDLVNSDRSNEFWLPMVQVRYKPFDWVDVRYAYTKTLARPDYHQLSPRVSMNYQLRQVWAGNPDLVPAQAYNHDLILSFHNNELGLLTVGGFYKTIKNFSYSTSYTLHLNAPEGIKTIYDFDINGINPNDGATVYTYVNSPYDATVKGIEVDFQTRLWYLPSPLDGVILGINYTHIKSEASYPFRNDRSYVNPNPPPRFISLVFDSTRSGRLIYQPDNILNTYIGFDYADFSCRVSFVFQENAVSYIGQFPEQDTFTRDYFRVDASARQMLPWAGFEVYLDMFNLNSRRNSSAQESIGGFSNEQNYGLTANLGVRFRL